MEKGVEAAMQEQLSALSVNLTRVRWCYLVLLACKCATGVFACACLCH